MSDAATIDQEQEQQAAAKIRQEKQHRKRGLLMRNLGAGAYKSGRKKGVDDNTGSKKSEFGRSLNFAGKLRRDKKMASELKKKVKGVIAQPAKMGASRLLQLAWTSLIASWGLTLIWINTHVFMHMVVPSVFCKLGEEWVPKQAMVAGGEASKTASKAVGWAEIFTLIFLDILALFIIGAILALLVMIVSWMNASWYKEAIIIKDVLFSVSHLSWGAVKALVELF